jgi:hypothetical protein
MAGSSSRSQAEVTDVEAVKALEEAWERLWPRPEGEAQAEFQRLAAEWEPRRALDPIALSADLLSPLGQALREPSHTLVLAYLLDSTAGHGLGVEPLKTFLGLIEGALPAEQREPFFEATGNEEGFVVLAERAGVLDGEGGPAARPRTDLWLEGPSKVPSAIIIVENKVEGRARPGQLALYEELLQERLRHLAVRPVIAKVFLTPWGDSPSAEAGGQGWLPLSLYDLALAWALLLDEKPSPGREYLRLYLATVLQKVCGIRWTATPSRSMREGLIRYLRIRLEKPE